MFELNLLNTSLLLAGACVLLIAVLLLYELRTNTSFAGVRYQVNPGPAPPVKDAFRTPQTPSLLHPFAPFFQQRMPWFRNLHPKAQYMFLCRVQQFMQARTFEGRSGLTVTDEMCLLISGEACRLTFGLTEFLLPDFNRILIYPDTFYSRSGKAKHNGEVNISGIIALSWKHFLQGISNSTDAVNLGLHEFTHALRFQGVRGGEKDPFFAMYYPKFRAVALRHMPALRKKKVLRSYGFTNDEEFLAVCAEHFFEAPQSLQTHAPEIYEQLCILLNQDPLNANGDVSHLHHKTFRSTVSADQVLFRSPESGVQYLSKSIIIPVVFAIGFIYSLGWNMALLTMLIPLALVILFRKFIYSGLIFNIHFGNETVSFHHRKAFSVQRIVLPYTAISKVSYIEAYGEEDDLTPEPAVVFDATGNRLSNKSEVLTWYRCGIQLTAITPQGEKEYDGSMGYLKPEHANALIAFLRQKNIWVRVQLQ